MPRKEIIMKKIEILFADDQPLFRTAILKDLLDFNIICVGEASNGKELLELIENDNLRIILLDLNMPEMDGNETFELIRLKSSNTKIIIFSLHNEQALIENYIERGASGYLPKSILIDTLAEAIIEVEKGHKYFLTHTDKKETKYSNSDIELIQEICRGKTNKQIASKIGISEKGIEKRRKSIYSKTKSINTAHFLFNVFERGLRFLGKK